MKLYCEVFKKYRKWVSDVELYIMLIPGVVFAFLFCYMPIYGITLAFREYNFVGHYLGGKWVGMKYLRQFFEDPYFFRLIRNTFMLNFLDLIFGFPLPIIFALMLNELQSRKFKKIAQSCSFLPYFISNVVVVGMVMKIFSSNGLVNNTLVALGFSAKQFFSDPKYFRGLYVGSEIWQNLGYSAVIYISALTAIAPELYEAAIIDGANRLQKIVHITIPGIMPTICVLLILQVGRMMSVGPEKVLLMYNPSIYETADIISTYVYRRGLIGFDYSFSTAVGLFNSVCNFILLIAANYGSRRISEYGLW